MNSHSRIFFLIFLLWVNHYANASVEADTLLANKLYDKGDSLYSLGKFDLAINFYTKAKSKYEHAKLWAKYANCLNEISHSYRHWGKYDKALFEAESALDVSTKYLGESTLEASYSYFNIASLLFQIGSFEEALEYENKSLTIRLALLDSNHFKISQNYNLRSGIFFRLGKLNRSISFMRKSIDILKAQRNIDEYAISNRLKNLGLIYWNTGDFDSSLYFNKKALDIRLRILDSNHSKLGSSYNGIGLAYLYKGMYNISIEYFNHALTIFKKTLDQNNIFLSGCYQNLGFAYLNIGQYENALKYTKKSLLIRENVYNNSKSSEISSIYVNLGQIYYKKNFYDSAKIYLNFALNTSKENNIAIADIFSSLASIALAEDSIELSSKYYRKAEQYLGSMILGNHPDKTRVINKFGEIEYIKQNFSNSILYYKKAILANEYEISGEQVDKYQDVNELLVSYLGLANAHKEIYFNTKDETSLIESLNSYKKCDSLALKLLETTINYNDKIKLLNLVSKIYSGAIELSIRAYSITNSKLLINLAFEFCEKSKARALSNVLTDALAKRQADIPQTLMDSIKNLKIDQTYYRNKLRDSYTSKIDSTILNKYQQRLFKTSRSLDSLFNYLEDKFPKYHKLKHATYILPISDIQAKLTSNTALIEYFIDTNKVYSFVITKKSQDVFTTELDSTDLNLISQLRNYSINSTKDGSNYNTTLIKRLHSFFSKHLEPAVTNLNSSINDLVIIPDGQLSYLPFDVLVTEESDNLDFRDMPYLIKKFNIQYGYSSSLHFEKPDRNYEYNNRELIAFAPEYRSSYDSIIIDKFSRFRNQVTELMWNRPETNSINRYIGGDIYNDSMAIESTFKVLAGDYRIIHLAMHAFIDDENPMESRLIFTQKTDSLEDNMLHAYEIYNMELKAEMAVLSACETGYGKFALGEGVMSLARAFSYAGCPSVVMSHWSVNDASTAKLMGYFYKNLAKGQEKHFALRQAKLEFLNNATLAQAHPYFWGSFVVMGDVKPIKDDSNYATLVIILFCIALIATLRYRPGIIANIFRRAHYLF